MDKLKKPGWIDGLGTGDCGIGVDAAGNVYIGANVKPRDDLFPKPFVGKVPSEDYVWWRRGERPVPWCYTYCNPYLFHWGSVFKFGPTGGAFYGLGAVPRPREGEPPPELSPLVSADNAPAGAASYYSGYLKREVKVTGALWRYGGMSIVPTSDLNWGDPSCICMSSRLAVDQYGRVFVPDCFRFGVEVLDTAGNHIMRVGRYGNVDSAGPGSKIPEPEIAFAWPAFVSVAQSSLYVSDPVNRRVTVVRFDHTEVAERKIP